MHGSFFRMMSRLTTGDALNSRTEKVVLTWRERIFEVLPPSTKAYNYGICVNQISLALKKFIMNNINIYVSN